MTKNRASEVDSGRKSIGRQRKGASFPAPAGRGELPADYTILLGQIKERICSERLRVVSAANEAMVLLYWDVGKAILGRQEQEGWGAKTIDRLSHDLREAFPELRGFSPRNLRYMRTFASFWPDREIVQQVVAQFPWGRMWLWKKARSLRLSRIPRCMKRSRKIVQQLAAQIGQEALAQT